MLIDTNTVVCDFYDCVKSYNVSNEIKNSELYRHYSDKNEIFDAEVTLFRKFVVHDFQKGVMYVNYTFEKYDKNDNLIRGAWRIRSKWYIKKKNNKWLVYDIKEAA